MPTSSTQLNIYIMPSKFKFIIGLLLVFALGFVAIDSPPEIQIDNQHMVSIDHDSTKVVSSTENQQLSVFVMQDVPKAPDLYKRFVDNINTNNYDNRILIIEDVYVEKYIPPRINYIS